MKTAVAAVIALSIASATAGSLRDEANEFLSILLSQGYIAAGVQGIEVQYLEPCTLGVSSQLFRERSGGYLIAMGGNYILDLELELQGEGWSVIDTFPDDLPVFELDSLQIVSSRRIILLAVDMTHGILQDSVIVMWALLPVDPD